MYRFARFLFLVWGWILPNLVHAQMVEWSNQQKVKNKTNYSQIIGSNTSGIYILKSKNNEFTRDLIIEKYKSNLSLEDSRDFWQPAGTFIEYTFLTEQGITVVASQKVNDKIELIYWNLDPSMNPPPQSSLLLQVDAAVFRNNSTFYVRHNQSHSILSVVFITQGTTKSESVLNLAQFNPQMQFVFQKKFPVQHETEDIYVTHTEPDNDGNMHILMDFPKEKGSKRRKENRDFYLYSYMQESKELLEYEIKKDSLTHLDDIGFTINNQNGVVTVAGFYRTGKKTELSGTFLLQCEPGITGSSAPVYTPFDNALLAKAQTVMQQEGQSGISDLYIKKIIPRSDGGCILIAEKFYETRQTYTYYVNGMPYVSYRSIYNFDEIVVLSLRADGTTQYSEIIKKKQSALSDQAGGGFSSFVLINTNNRLVFIYNSDMTTEGDVMMSTFAPNGVSETRILIKSLSFYVAVLPGEYKQIAANVALLCTLKDKRFSLLRLTF